MNIQKIPLFHKRCKSRVQFFSLDTYREVFNKFTNYLLKKRNKYLPRIIGFWPIDWDVIYRHANTSVNWQGVILDDIVDAMRLAMQNIRRMKGCSMIWETLGAIEWTISPEDAT